MKNIKAAALAIRTLNLGSSTDPEICLQLFDLIPAAWFGAAGESRREITLRISKAMAYAALSAPDKEVWEPTMELRQRSTFLGCGHHDQMTLEQKFVRVSGGVAGIETAKWRPVPLTDSQGHGV